MFYQPGEFAVTMAGTRRKNGQSSSNPGKNNGGGGKAKKNEKVSTENKRFSVLEAVVDPPLQKVNDPCIVCDAHVESGSYGMQCDVCLKWTHHVCAGLKESDDYDCVNLWFVCVECLEFMKSMRPGLQAARKRKREMSQLVKDINECIDEVSDADSVSKKKTVPNYADVVKSDMMEMRKEMREIKVKMLEKVNTVSEAMLEVKEKDRRASNVIIHQLKEAGDDVEGKEHDSSTVKKLFDAIGCGAVEAHRVFRLGPKRSDGSPRLLLVDVGGKDNRDSVLRRAPNLRRCTEFERIFISEDRTPSEQEAIRKLVLEKKEKQKNDTEHIYVIRNYRLVQLKRREVDSSVMSSTVNDDRTGTSGVSASVASLSSHSAGATSTAGDDSGNDPSKK